MRLRLLFLPAFFIAFVVQAQTISWIKKNGPVGGAIKDIEVDPATGKIFLLDGDQKPYVSVDNGNSWQKVTFADGDRFFNDIEITNNTIFFVGYWDLYASTDGGATFASRMTTVSPYQGAYRLKRQPTGGNLIVLCQGGTIYSSSNNGQTWTLKTSTLGNVDLRYLEINSVDQIFILKPVEVTFEVRPFRSSDGGTAFTETSSGITLGHQVLGLYGENNGGNIYAITNSNLFSSTNGASWSSVKTGSIADLTISDYGDLNNSILEFSSDGLGVFFIDNVNHKLHSKTLSATSWSLQATDFPSGTLSVSGAAAKDYPSATTATAYFSTPSGVYKTNTGGASVSENNSGIASIKAEQIISDNSGYLYLRTNSLGLLKSIDGGDNWAKVSGVSSDIRYFFANGEGSALFAITDYNIFSRSYDQGSSWFPLGPSGGFLWASAAGDKKIFGLQSDYVSSGYPLSLYYSPDNGSTWTSTPVTVSGLPASYSIYLQSIFFASANRMFLDVYDNGLGVSSYYRIDFVYNASDAITSATATKITNVPLGGDIDKVTGANGKFYAYNDGPTDQIAVSSDGGTNWITRTAPQSNAFYMVKNGYLFFVDGNSSKVHISRDDGTTFIETTLPAGTNAYSIQDISLDNSGYAYLAFYGDYVYQTENTVVLPAAPTTLEQVGFSSNAVALRWVDPNIYERDIIIERSLNGTDFTTAGQMSGWNICYGTPNRGFFVDTNLLPGTLYTYKIKAKNAAGVSASTTTITVTTLAACSPTIPDNRSWSAINSGAEGYALLSAAKTVGVKHLGSGKYEISDLSLGLTGSSTRGTFYESCGQTFVGLVNNPKPNGNSTWNGSTTLKLKWRSCYEDKTETITLTLNATDPAPAKPAALFAYVISNTSVELKWNSAYYEKSYVVERSQSPSSGFVSIATVNYPETTYIDNGSLTEGTTYYYRIRSRNGNATPLESLDSDVVSVPFAKPNFIIADNAITDFKTFPTLGSMWADFNNDGLEDYFTMQLYSENAGKPVIFKNLGNGNFEQFTPTVADVAYFLPSIADFDNDNYPDLALSGNGTRILDIYKGTGDFTFTKVPAGQLGDLSVIEKDIASTSWADINNDGLSDLMVLNEDDGSFTLYKQNANHTFTNIFEDIPVSANRALLSIWADYDNDGYQDVLIGNDDGPARLYHNNGNETFTLITGNGLTASRFFAAAWGDYNNDGNIDLFCGNSTLNSLYKNNGDGTFTEDVSTAISEANSTISASWGDYNNDGYLDLLTAGFPGYQTRLFLRDPSVTTSVVFKKIISEKVNDLSVSHYSVANADHDQNGLLDVSMSALIFDGAGGDGLTPTNNSLYQNNNTPGNWSEVKLNPVNGNTETLGAKITLTAGGRTQTRQLSASSSLVARSSTVAHFGLGASTTITNIQVRWPSGALQNYPLPPANQILIIDEDVQAPAITSKIPAHSATNVEINTTITIVFDENTFAENGKKILITKTGESTPFSSIDATSGTKTGNQYVFTLSATLSGETEYNVTIEAGAFRDRYANPSAAVATGEWKFTTQSVADVIPPAITFTLPASPAKGFGTLNPSVTVTDNIGVNTVVLSIRKISGSGYQDIAATAGTAANTYSAALSEATHFDAIGAEFYITATDGAGNSKRDPADPNATHKVYISYSAAQAAIPTSSLGFGGTKTGWKVFALPFEISSPNNGFTAIFNELSSKTNKTDYRLITYGTLTKWSEYPEAFSTLSRGVGYFINIKTDQGAIDLFDLTAPPNHRSNLYQMNLKVGWNMVGNPYLTPISWDDVADLNGLTGTEAQLKKFSAGTYSNNQNLDQYEGGFVLMETAKTISIPFLGQTSSGGRKGTPALGSDISADAWALPIALNQDGLKYGLSGIGMAPEAGASIDEYDDVTPPRFFDYLEVNFDHPEHIAKRFTRDVVPTQQNYTWDFTVDSNLEGMAELTWNNAPLMGSGKDIFLLDVSSQKLLDMKEKGSYRFDPKEAPKFRIYYGDNLNIAPERVQLGKAYPNPTNGFTTIGFSLPETGGIDQSVTLDLLDALGRTVGTIKQGQFVPGYHEAAFDAKEMLNGFYTYRLTVKSRGGHTTEVNKLIIK